MRQSKMRRYGQLYLRNNIKKYRDKIIQHQRAITLIVIPSPDSIVIPRIKENSNEV